MTVQKKAKEDTPASPKEVGQFVFKKVWRWAAIRPVWVKLLIAIFGLALFIGIARLNLVGEQAYRISKHWLSIRIPGVDSVPNLIPVLFEFEVGNDIGQGPSKLDVPCQDGERIRLRLKAETACWGGVYNMDLEGVYGLLQNKREPSKLEPGKIYEIDVELNDTPGIEVYYLVVAPDKFTFVGDIQPYLPKRGDLTKAKGPKATRYGLRLPEPFVHRYLYCRHVK